MGLQGLCEEAEDKVGKKVAVGFEGLGMRIFPHLAVKNL